MQYELGLGAAGSITPRLDWLSVTQAYGAPQNHALNRIPAYGLANLRLTYRDQDDRWELSFEGTNLLDKYYFTNMVGNCPAGDPAQTQVAYVGSPRMFEITLRRNLN